MPSPRELLEDFLTERALYVSENTVYHDNFHLDRFFCFLEEKGVSDVALVTFQELDDYVHHMDTVFPDVYFVLLGLRSAYF